MIKCGQGLWGFASFPNSRILFSSKFSFFALLVSFLFSNSFFNSPIPKYSRGKSKKRPFYYQFPFQFLVLIWANKTFFHFIPRKIMMLNDQSHDFDFQNGSDGRYRNPYSRFRFCCTNLYIKDHAQLCGVISFSLFLCLIVISLMIFGALSIFYIVSGIIVYTFLMKSLFACDDKMYVLLYLLFEAIQIGFNLALALYVALPILVYHVPTVQNCEPYSHLVNGTSKIGRICSEYSLAGEYMELVLFILLLVSIKLYFARVFAHFYKYLVWSEKILIQSAQYINGRWCVQISALNNLFPPPPPSFWDNSVVLGNGYGYDQPEFGTRIDALENFADLPSYAQAMGQQQKLMMPQIEEGQVVDVNMENVNGMAVNGPRLNLHV